jgi:hypothetical protein
MLAKVEKAETVNSGSAEPDQANTCEGNKSKLLFASVRQGRSHLLLHPSSDKPSPF